MNVKRKTVRFQHSLQTLRGHPHKMSSCFNYHICFCNVRKSYSLLVFTICIFLNFDNKKHLFGLIVLGQIPIFIQIYILISR